MAKPDFDRRAHARFPRSFDLEGTHQEGATTARMVARDLSLGGLHCTSTTDFPEMTRLCVRLMLPDGPTASGPVPVDAEAVVVRREPLDSASGNSRYALALYFTKISDEQREVVARFLARS